MQGELLSEPLPLSSGLSTGRRDGGGVIDPACLPTFLAGLIVGGASFAFHLFLRGKL